MDKSSNTPPFEDRELGLPRQSGRELDGPLRRAVSKPDTRRNSKNGDGPADGHDYRIERYRRGQVSGRKFNVASRDYERFARLVTRRLTASDCWQEHGVFCVCFYQCQHDLRLDCERARALLRDFVHVDHPHVDVVQIHRADTIWDEHGRPYVIREELAGKQSPLWNLFRDATIFLDGKKIKRYHVGFLSRCGNFTRLLPGVRTW